MSLEGCRDLRGEGVLNVGGGDKLGDSPGTGGGWKQQFRWDFSMHPSRTLTALKGISVPQNHRWRGRVYPGILQHKEETACCLAWRFWGRKGGSGDQEKTAPLAPWGWGTGCLLWHGQGWMGTQGS